MYLEAPDIELENGNTTSFVFRLNNVTTTPHITINPQQIEYIHLVEDDLAVVIHMVSGTNIYFRVISNTTFTDKDKDKIIDEVLVTYFKAPKSYTTEDMCEINSHGGSLVVKKILEIMADQSWSLIPFIAEPEMFTTRWSEKKEVEVK